MCVWTNGDGLWIRCAIRELAFPPRQAAARSTLLAPGGGEPLRSSTIITGATRDALDLTREINFPHSIGLLYSAFTYYTGFKVNSGEYKVMGLAPYGEPTFAKTILDNLVDLKEDGTFRLDQSYLDYCTFPP